jgi:hypothetical protein
MMKTNREQIADIIYELNVERKEVDAIVRKILAITNRVPILGSTLDVGKLAEQLVTARVEMETWGGAPEAAIVLGAVDKWAVLAVLSRQPRDLHRLAECTAEYPDRIVIAEGGS